MLRSNFQHAISVGNLTFKAHGLFRQVAFKVLIEHRQIVDADETGVELVSAELGKGESQFAIDRIAAVASGEGGDGGLTGQMPHACGLYDRIG